MTMNVFATLTKIDVEKKLVFARATQEIVDKSGEIMDYSLSVPNFKKWSDEVSNDTGGKSLGNVRAMHGKVAAGKLTHIDYNDAEKAIDVCVFVSDDQEFRKCVDGTYAGLSIGGSYGAKSVEKMDGANVTRYEAIPNEISLVDRPCCPTAKFFDIQKADGIMEKVAFKNQPVDEISVDGTPEEADALAKLLSDNGLSIGDALAVVAASLVKVEPAEDLKKSLYDVSSLCQIVESVQSLIKYGLNDIADGEADDAPIINRLKEVSATLAGILKDFAAHEADEIIGGTEENQMQMADMAHELLKAGARNSKGDAAMLKTIHDHVVALGAECAPAAKAETPEDLQKRTDDLQKAISDATEPLHKRIKELEALPAPAVGVLMSVGKGDETAEEVQKIAPVVSPVSGEVSEVATLIKASRGNMRTIY